MLGDLSKKYESNGDPAAISSGVGDLGGKSYGMYQMSSNLGVVDEFVKWLDKKTAPLNFACRLLKYPVGSTAFDEAWVQVANKAPLPFDEMQHQFVKERYYDVAKKLLKDAMYDLDNHTEVMQDVVWSRAVQYGPYQIVEMFTEACKSLGYPNLSYVDDRAFDYNMIEAVYQNVCKSEKWTNGSPALREGLYARFDAECAEALARV
ncbi:MAG: hypothetical protein IKK97_02290 [Phascolarctobacterium sp.]|nr:hypothetical protein [Phascolarctobacterium sp.]